METSGSFSQRLMELIIALGMNKNSFAMKIGLSDNATIVRIVNDPARGASYPILRAIFTTFPEVNPRWLILGEGEMFEKDEWRKRRLYTMYYKLSSFSLEHFSINDPPPDPIDIMRIHGYYDCEVAFDVFGDSMEPRFNNGDLILCRIMTPGTPIIFGEAYILQTNHDAPLRYIKGETDTHYKVSAESKRIDDALIKKDDVIRFFKIRGVIRRVAL